MLITRAPLRVSFFGGGTDYPAHFREHGGAVIGSALDQYAFITASEFRSIGLFDYTIRATYRQIENVSALDDLQHVPIREALRRCGFAANVEIHHIADLPAKTGLGSSSSFTVSLLQALYKLRGRDISGLELAYEAIDFERNTLRESVGCQDQTFAAVGGFNVLEFRREDDIGVHPVNLSADRLQELEASLFMVYSGVTRAAEDVVKAQLTQVDQNKDRYLRMRRQVDEAYQILTGNKPLSAFGELLDKAWQEKKALHSVISNPVIDEMYSMAKSSGAIGGKLLGAGGGGFLLLFVPPQRMAQVQSAMSNYCTIRPQFGAPGSSVIFDGSRMRSPVTELRKVSA